MKTILLAVGGTGGHILPAIELEKHLAGKVLFAGVCAQKHPLFKDKENVFSVSGGAISLKPSIATLSNALLLLKGIRQSLSLISKQKVDFVVGFGSYHSLPLLIAAMIKKVPFFLYEPNAVFGRVNRLLAPFSKGIGMYYPKKGKKIFPLSFSQKEEKLGEDPYHYFHLHRSQQTLLVFGGSQGALKINQWIRVIHSEIPMQFLHFIGKNDDIELTRKTYLNRNFPTCVKEFESNMSFAYSVANFAISRAGASTIKELIENEVPAILIPFPFAQDQHQRKNAEFFINVIGGGIMLIEKQITAQKLLEAIKLLKTNQEKYKNNIKRFRKNHNGINLANHIEFYLRNL